MYKLYGTIDRIRKIEDAVRMTGQYTEGLFKEYSHHPVQGEESTRAFTKEYELYIDAPLHNINDEITEGINDAFAWLKGRAVIFKFWYDYRKAEANMRVSEEGLRLAVDTFEGIALAVYGYVPEKAAENVPIRKTWYDRLIAIVRSA